MNLEKSVLFLTILFFVGCKSEIATSEQIVEDVVKEQQTVNAEQIVSNNKLETIKQYIPESYKILYDFDENPHLVTGDFNGDKIKDFAITITSCLEEDCNSLDNEMNIHVVIFEGDGSKFIEKTRSGNLSDFYSDHYHSLSIEKNVIILESGATRYMKSLKIRYEDKHDNYMLIGSDEMTSGNYEMMEGTAGTISTNYLTGIRLINYNKYDEEKGSIVLPEKKLKVSKNLKPLSEISNTNCNDL
jgi:hypothetical protein